MSLSLCAVDVDAIRFTNEASSMTVSSMYADRETSAPAAATAAAVLADAADEAWWCWWWGYIGWSKPNTPPPPLPPLTPPGGLEAGAPPES